MAQYESLAAKCLQNDCHDGPGADYGRNWYSGMPVKPQFDVYFELFKMSRKHKVSS